MRRRRGIAAILVLASFVALALVVRACAADPRSGAPTISVQTAGLAPNSRPHTGDAGVKPRASGALRVEGQVIDNREAPVENATVRITKGEDFADDISSAADGTFAFEHLAAGHYYIAALKGDQFSNVAQLDLSAALTEPLVLQIIAGHAIVVRVRDARTGAALAGASFNAWAHDGEETTSTRRCTTSADGTCTLHGLGFGWRFIAWASCPGYEPQLVQKLLEVDPAVGDEVDVELHHGAPVSGIVTDTNGRLIEGRTVSIDGHHSSDTVESGPDGRWRFESVAAGPHQLKFSTGDHVSTLVLNPDGVHPLGSIELVVDAPEALEPLSGTVVDEAGRPVEGVNLYARMYTPLRQDETVTDAAGRFTVKLPPTRAFQVKAWKDELVSDTAVSEAERRVPLRIVVRRSVIEGDVVDHRGKPVANAQVIESRSEVARSDGHGHFVVRGVRDETAELAAYAPDRRFGGSFAGKEVKVGDTHVRLVVDDVSSVVGRVELDGKPLDSYTMNLSDGTQMEYAGFKDEVVHAADGRFTLRGIPAGNLQITIKGIGFPPKELPLVHVTAGRDVDLGTIALDRGQVIRGRVLDPTGTPIPGAIVTAHRHGPYSYMSAADLSADGAAMTKSDAAGNFTLSGFIANEATRIVATHPTRGSSGERIVDTRTAAIDLVLRSTGAIDGSIDGWDYFVTVSRVDDRAFSAACEVDWTQRFSCENLEPGTYVVFVEGEAVLPKRVMVRAGERTHVDLQKSRTSVAAVFDASAPCTKIAVETADDFHDLVEAHACNEPTFRQLVPGPYRVCIDGERCSSITLASAPEEQHFRLP